MCRQRRRKPAKDRRRQSRADELRHDEPGASAGRMPAKVSVAARAKVTAGFAKLVEGVNQ
jgi:hypothetical protein